MQNSALHPAKHVHISVLLVLHTPSLFSSLPRHSSLVVFVGIVCRGPLPLALMLHCYVSVSFLNKATSAEAYHAPLHTLYIYANDMQMLLLIN